VLGFVITKILPKEVPSLKRPPLLYWREAPVIAQNQSKKAFRVSSFVFRTRAGRRLRRAPCLRPRPASPRRTT